MSGVTIAPYFPFRRLKIIEANGYAQGSWEIHEEAAA